ncbi:MAG: Zn-ribbon domain-containing OB-fold protein [Halodesulfurarchaeum sp.]
MTLEAYRCERGHLTIPSHPNCPTCGADQVETVDLTKKIGNIVTWTTATAPPPGVRSPNHLAIVEFEVNGEAVTTIGQLTTGDVRIGDAVTPVHVEELRDPSAGIRHPDSQAWDGYRFEPVD